MFSRNIIVWMCILPALTLHLVTTETQTTSTLGNETLGGLSAREKPELSEHLSVLIGEDVAKNIEYKRLIEQAELGASPQQQQRQQQQQQQQQPYLTTPSTPPNQKSRIQVKTAPNGVDYEYEYVYYYYDEDEDTNKTTSASAVPSRDNKNHYEVADVTAKSHVDDSVNEGRASKIDEDERLPKNTRFPPRETLEVTSEPAAKIVVKHPSSDLVDSDTFNTADNRNSPTTTTTTSTSTQSPKDQVMEKAAFDLYAILQNEKMTMDPTEINTLRFDPTTLPPTTEINTFAPEPTRLPIRRTSTSQPVSQAPETTQKPPVVNHQPIVAKAAPSLKSEHTASASPWIRSKNKQSTFTTTTTTTTTTERASFAPKSRYNKGGNASNRVNSFARTLSTTVPSTTQAERSERPSFGGRSTRNRSRFNIQPTTEASTTAAAAAVDSRPSRPRATFSARSRNKAPSSTTPAATPSADVVVSTEASSTAQARVTLPNRLGVNRLLAQRNRNNLIRHGGPSTTAKPNVTASGENEESNTSQEASAPLTTEEPERIESTSSQTGLNRLKNRPRIQIHPIDRTKGPTTQNVIFNQRKVNPLIARRQFGLTSSTSEAPSSADETLEESEDKERAEQEAEPEEENETTEAAPSSEPPHGLRLLDPHRRLSLRRPGTITRRQREIGSSYAI